MRSGSLWRQFFAGTRPSGRGARRFADLVGQDALHGIGTPITLQLWNQRLRRDTEMNVTALPAQPSSKAPFRTVVNYPFSKDRALHEKVFVMQEHQNFDTVYVNSV